MHAPRPSWSHLLRSIDRCQDAMKIVLVAYHIESENLGSINAVPKRYPPFWLAPQEMQLGTAIDKLDCRIHIAMIQTQVESRTTGQRYLIGICTVVQHIMHHLLKHHELTKRFIVTQQMKWRLTSLIRNPWIRTLLQKDRQHCSRYFRCKHDDVV
jgi:hypothetical protein